MSSPSVLIHCNAGGPYGMGHAMRSLAIAEEAVSRGWRVKILGDLDPVSVNLLKSLGSADVSSYTLTTVPDELRRVIEVEAPTVLHIDSYSGNYGEFRNGPWLFSNMQDGSFGARPADLAIDANIGADVAFGQTCLSRVQLGGPRVAAVRAEVRAHRVLDRAPAPGAMVKVLVVLGGTDPYGLTLRVLAALDSVVQTLAITVVNTTGSDQVASAAAHSRHTVRVVPFAQDLPALADDQDFVVSAAGTSVLDFACMGLPMALICVTENQSEGYARAIAAHLAVPLGTPPHLDLAERCDALNRILMSRAALSSLSHLGTAAVDGLGSWRIVSAWEALVAGRNSEPAYGPEWSSRPATTSDAYALFAWRNDPETRRRSRSRAELSWAEHRQWLELALRDKTRQLVVVMRHGLPVGTVRWDQVESGAWAVSITVAPEYRGRGYARSVLAIGEAALKDMRVSRLIASIHRENIASRRLFVGAGYLPDLPPDAAGFARYVKQRLK